MHATIKHNIFPCNCNQDTAPSNILKIQNTSVSSIWIAYEIFRTTFYTGKDCWRLVAWQSSCQNQDNHRWLDLMTRSLLQVVNKFDGSIKMFCPQVYCMLFQQLAASLQISICIKSDFHRLDLTWCNRLGATWCNRLGATWWQVLLHDMY